MTTSNGQAKRWFYVREGRRHGPVETAKLVDLVLGGEVPEDSLVWHSGLPEWLPAQEVEDIRRELPPPVPTQRIPPPPDPVPRDAAEGEGPPQDEAAAAEETPGTSDPADFEDPINGLKRKRKRKRHRDSRRRPPWLWPLVAVLIGLMIFLWWLLRRMNEVPPGRIIQTGSVEMGSRGGGAGSRLSLAAASASRWAESPVSAPGSRPARPA
jgi:hypothetical protein